MSIPLNSDFNFLDLEQKGHCVLITIQRPKQLNALNKQLIHELSQAFTLLDKHSQVRVILLTGAGDKAFVAGADIKEFSGFTPQQAEDLALKGQQLLFDKIAYLSKPVIALINGYALGGGLELALSCHLRIASENAQFGFPEPTLGLIPGYGGTQRLPQLIGKSRALQILLSASPIKATTAQHWGLVNELTTVSDLQEKGLELAWKIAQNSPNAISKILEVLQVQEHSLDQGLHKEAVAFGQCFQTADFKEGITAFLEKRKPCF